METWASRTRRRRPSSQAESGDRRDSSAGTAAAGERLRVVARPGSEVTRVLLGIRREETVRGRDGEGPGGRARRPADILNAGRRPRSIAEKTLAGVDSVRAHLLTYNGPPTPWATRFPHCLFPFVTRGAVHTGLRRRHWRWFALLRNERVSGLLLGRTACGGWLGFPRFQSLRRTHTSPHPRVR